MIELDEEVIRLSDLWLYFYLIHVFNNFQLGVCYVTCGFSCGLVKNLYSLNLFLNSTIPLHV